MPKIDFKNALKVLYQPSPAVPVIVIVPQMKFVMFDGKGNPDISQDYHDAIEALFAVSYTISSMLRNQNYDYEVMPLEGLFWVDGEDFSLDNKDEFSWISMIMQPDRVTEDIFNRAIVSVTEKKNPAAIEQVRFDSLHEGKSVQILHIGPHSTKQSSIDKIHSHAKKCGYQLHGKYHEIYLNDPSRTESSKIKTVIRHPVK
ncbi:MAG: hypothetical protein BAJATHORv1_60053 [Candidatus Thorarchaeota archaeon]|nr:MAG: hypothetical protein BAJATHORv1_60053 [Candidatus Thorarchaeota archaeon]